MNEPLNSLPAALDLLSRQADKLAVSLSPAQLELLRLFLVDLYAYNEHTNLVSRADPLTVVEHHVVDSLAVVPLLMQRSASLPGSSSMRLLDIGSGAGFPAMVLAVAMPDLCVTLIEAVGKKARFLEQLTGRLGFSERVDVLNDRAETIGHDASRRAKYDVATARAVGRLDLVSELCLPFLKPGGVIVLQKSQAQIELETKCAHACLPALGGKLRESVVLPAHVTGKQNILMIVEKVGSTPGIYPRSPARIKRSPLGGASSS